MFLFDKEFWKRNNIFKSSLYNLPNIDEYYQGKELSVFKKTFADYGLLLSSYVTWISLIRPSVAYTTRIKNYKWILFNIARKITYETDIEKYNKVDVWEAPNVTLSRKAADCEGHAILLCSILVKYGYTSRVALGFTRKHKYHSWVILYKDGKIMYLDPTVKNIFYNILIFIFPTFFLNPKWFGYNLEFSFDNLRNWTHI